MIISIGPLKKEKKRDHTEKSNKKVNQTTHMNEGRQIFQETFSKDVETSAIHQSMTRIQYHMHF